MTRGVSMIIKSIIRSKSIICCITILLFSLQTSIGFCLNKNDISDLATIQNIIYPFFYVNSAEDVDKSLMGKINHIFPQKLLIKEKHLKDIKDMGFAELKITKLKQTERSPFPDKASSEFHIEIKTTIYNKKNEKVLSDNLTYNCKEESINITFSDNFCLGIPQLVQMIVGIGTLFITVAPQVWLIESIAEKRSINALENHIQKYTNELLEFYNNTYNNNESIKISEINIHYKKTENLSIREGYEKFVLLFYKNQSTLDAYIEMRDNFKEINFVQRIWERAAKEYAEKQNLVEIYNDFLHKIPDSQYFDYIKNLKEDLEFKHYTEIDTIKSYNEFISNYSSNKHVIDAKYRIALKMKTLESLQLFVNSNPTSDYTPSVNTLISYLKADTHGTCQNYNNFFKNYTINDSLITYNSLVSLIDKLVMLIDTERKVQCKPLTYFFAFEHTKKSKYLKFAIDNNLDQLETIYALIDKDVSKYIPALLDYYSKINTIDSYNEFYKYFSQYSHAFNAEENIIKKLFSLYIKKNSIEGYDEFIHNFKKSNSKYLDLAIGAEFKIYNKFHSIDKYDEFIQKFQNYPAQIYKAILAQFELTAKKNTISSYDKFISKFPKSKIVSNAIRNEFSIYKKINTIKAYNEFIKKFPNSQFVSDAKNIIFKLNLKNKNPNELYLNAGKYEAQQNFNYAYKTYEYIIEKYPKHNLAIKANDRMLLLTEKIREIQKQRELLDEQRRIANNPCYGIKLVDWWVERKGGLFPSDEETLWVKIKNVSNLTKYVYFRFYSGGSWQTADYKVKVYSRDIAEGKADHTWGWKSGYGYRKVEISYCE